MEGKQAQTEIRNGKISRTMLGTEDHGLMTFMLHIDFGGSGQGFGGYGLDQVYKEDDKFVKRIGSAMGLSVIMEILKVLEVDTWEELPGTYLRAEGTWHKLTRIGHVLKDQWFDIEAFIEEHKNNPRLNCGPDFS